MSDQKYDGVIFAIDRDHPAWIKIRVPMSEAEALRLLRACGDTGGCVVTIRPRDNGEVKP